jgi:Uma2 family endonuclease
MSEAVAHSDAADKAEPPDSRYFALGHQGDFDRTQIAARLAMTPTERLRHHESWRLFVKEALNCAALRRESDQDRTSFPKAQRPGGANMSTAVQTSSHYTPEDLLAMPDGKSYELVGGRLVARIMGAESSYVGGELYFRLRLHCRDREWGLVWPADNGFQCFTHEPGLVRRPDVSFVKSGRLPGDVAPKGWVRIPSDLAIEVVLPNDLVEALEEKLDDYRKVDVRLIWVIFPELRKVKVLRRDGSVNELKEDDELSGEDVIPGFHCPVREILPPRPQPPRIQPAPNGPQ